MNCVHTACEVEKENGVPCVRSLAHRGRAEANKRIDDGQ
jgi:hypothetical protein